MSHVDRRMQIIHLVLTITFFTAIIQIFLWPTIPVRVYHDDCPKSIANVCLLKAPNLRTNFRKLKSK